MKAHRMDLAVVVFCIILSACTARVLAAANQVGLCVAARHYLDQTPKYSLFAEIVQKLNESTAYESSTAGWFGAPTNQTILLVNNTVLRSEFTQLAKQHNISSPGSFLRRLIDIAEGDIEQGRDNTTFSAANWAAIALVAFAGSHTLPAPHNFYKAEDVLHATNVSPVNLTTSLAGPEQYAGNVQAYAAPKTTSRPLTTVFLRQSGGLQHAQNGLAVPRSFLTATHKRASAAANKGGRPARLYVYELDGIFFYGQPFRPANDTDHSGRAALQYFQAQGV